MNVFFVVLSLLPDACLAADAEAGRARSPRTDPPPPLVPDRLQQRAARLRTSAPRHRQPTQRPQQDLRGDHDDVPEGGREPEQDVGRGHARQGPQGVRRGEPGLRALHDPGQLRPRARGAAADPVFGGRAELHLLQRRPHARPQRPLRRRVRPPAALLPLSPRNEDSRSI